MRKFIAFLGAVLVAASLAGGAGAGSKPTGPDLSSPTAIANYLTSKGIDPSTVVTQTGLNNYAGPNCPGLGWTCTTSARVVQVAAPGGQNVSDCSTSMTDECISIQQGDTRNTATCIEHTAPVQHCMITQAGARNFARVDQSYSDNSATSEAVQTADVSQTGATDKNELQLDQDVDQKTSTGATQSQNAHQFAVVQQTASGNANNFAHVHQAQNQDEGGGASVQNQNTTAAPSFANQDAATTAANCVGPSGVPNPNLCARFEQWTDGGNNDAHLHQLGSEAEKSSAAAVQTQGRFDGGEGSSLDQYVTGSGSSRNESVQHKQQQAKSNGGTATQWDPVRCCGVSQVGGTNDRNDTNQFVVQSASGATYAQHADVTGHVDIVPNGEFAAAQPAGGPTGMCSISHHVQQNDAGTNQNVSQPAPCDLFLETSCTSTNVASTDAAAQTPCVTPALATSGSDLPVFDVTAEPASYSTPSWYESF